MSEPSPLFEGDNTMFNPAVSNFNIDNVSNSFGQGTQQLEDSLDSMMQKIQTEANPSTGDLLMLQSVLAKYQSIVQSETNVVKLLGDSLRSIATNIGS